MIGYRAKGTIYNDRRPSQNLAGVLRGALSPPVGPGHSPVGAPGRTAPGSSKDPKVYISKRRPKTDNHGALLTQDIAMITFLSPEF